MRALYKAKCIQVEITNFCNLRCPNCTRFIGHHQKPYFMSLEQVEIALQSLEGYKGKVGIMGGEPTMHNQFKEICLLYQEYLPKERRGLWTNGLNWNKYEDIIRVNLAEETYFIPEEAGIEIAKIARRKGMFKAKTIEERKKIIQEAKKKKQLRNSASRYNNLNFFF